MQWENSENKEETHQFDYFTKLKSLFEYHNENKDKLIFKKYDDIDL